MPATFAHPVFAIPFRRLRLPVSALALGAMAPDVAYLLPVWNRWIGHTLPGIFTFGLPVGLLAWVCFGLWVKPGLYGAAPRPLQVAFRAWRHPPDWRAGSTWARAALGTGLGAATHVGIDEFTHDYGAAVHAWPELFLAPVVGALPVYKVLQYGLGVGGSAVLAAWVLAAYRRGPRVEWSAADLRDAGRLLAAAAALAGLGAAYGLSEAAAPKSVLVRSVAATLVLTAAALLGWGWLYALRRRA